MKILTRCQLKSISASVAIALAFCVMPFSATAFDFPAQGDFALGAQQWADNCTRCHNLRGPNDLRDDQWITTMFHMRLRAGLTGNETQNILTFLQASNGSLTTESPLETSESLSVSSEGGTMEGKAIYDQTCIACHGANGKGALPGVPDLTDTKGRLSQSDDVLLVNIVRGQQSAGSSMAMPPKGGNPTLSEDDIRSVIEYLRSGF
jgi:mono/diheme cytochrome c family protein